MDFVSRPPDATSNARPYYDDELGICRNPSASEYEPAQKVGSTDSTIEVYKNSVEIPGYSCPQQVAPTALKQAQDSGLPGLHNGPADAYRHCWWSCEMVKQCSSTSSYIAGTGHEITSYTQGESEMDLHNNAAGRACGDEISSCDSCCRDELDKGNLVTSPKP